jgi:ubiquinone/menaquinone biosynthesis C-methylase UbiE
VPERIRWAVETLDVQPDDVLLEIGCGGGVAVQLICPRLEGGSILAIDRSATMIDRAKRRNSGCLTAGTASFRVAALETAELDEAAFTKIFAINVNLFWVRDGSVELRALARALPLHGRLYLCYEPPTIAQVEQLADTVSSALARAGFHATTIIEGHLLCIIGAP